MLADPRASWVPAFAPRVAAARATPTTLPRRLRTWDLSANLHCSIIGTCLSAHELRRLLRKLGLGAPDATDHALHGLGVSLASRQDAAAKLLNLALDDRHHAAIRRFAAARDLPALRAAGREAGEREAAQLRPELAVAEAALAIDEAEPGGEGTRFAGTVLYVGGRSGQTAALRRAATRHGVQLLHHDAEQGAALLPGLVGRADLVAFPVDCVSHDAALAVKRLCRQSGRPFRALRSTGLGSLLQALEAHPPAAP